MSSLWYNRSCFPLWLHLHWVCIGRQLSPSTSVVAHLWDLHGQLQALPGVVAGVEQAAVKLAVAVAATVVIVAVATHRLGGRGKVVVGREKALGRPVARAGQHEAQVVEPAEEAGQHDASTVVCRKSRRRGKQKMGAWDGEDGEHLK